MSKGMVGDEIDSCIILHMFVPLVFNFSHGEGKLSPRTLSRDLHTRCLLAKCLIVILYEKAPKSILLLLLFLNYFCLFLNQCQV